MKINILSILISLSFTINSYSQITFGKDGTFTNKWHPGTLVLKNKDTLKGFIKYETSSITKSLFGLSSLGKNKILFKKTDKSKDQVKHDKYLVDYLIVQNNSGETIKFKYVKTSNNRLKLFQVLIEGKVSVYLEEGVYNMNFNSGATTFQQSRNLYYVQKQEDDFASNRFFPNALKSFKKNAARYFSDCKSVVEKINSGEYKSKQLIQIIQEYNRCE